MHHEAERHETPFGPAAGAPTGVVADQVDPFHPDTSGVVATPVNPPPTARQNPVAAQLTSS
jgi:hypothetical protein